VNTVVILLSQGKSTKVLQERENLAKGRPVWSGVVILLSQGKSTKVVESLKFTQNKD